MNVVRGIRRAWSRRRDTAAVETDRPAPGAPALLQRLNPDSHARATGQKVILYRHLAALGLPTPELLGVVGRAGGWSAARNRPVLGRAAVAEFLADLSQDIVVKPSAGSGGLGVRVLRHRAAQLVDLDGGRWEAAGLAAEILADPAFELFVVQERLSNHPDIDRLCPVETLQTARFTTLAPPRGELRIVHAHLQLAPRGGNVDSLGDSERDTVAVAVDVPTGVLCDALPSGVGAPPGAGDRALPDWDAACALVLRASRALMPQRAIGWDVALTPRGPLLLDADSSFGRAGGGLEEGLAAVERALATDGPAHSGVPA